MPTGTSFRLRKERGVGDVINATFAFIRQEFTPLLKSLLFIVGPLLGAGMALNTYGQVASMRTVGDPASIADPTAVGVFSLLFIVAYPLILLSLVLAVTVVYGYVRVYEANDGRSPSVDEVWAYVKREFWSVFAVLFVVGLAFLAAYIVLVLGFILGVGGVATVLGRVGATLSGIIIFVGLLAGLFYLMTSWALAVPAHTFEPLGAGDALGRAWRLVAGRRWSTLGVIFASSLIQGILGIVFQIPLYAVIFGSALVGAETGSGFLWSVLSLLTGAVGGVGVAVLYAIPLLALLFQYFSIVEQKEQVGLMERVRRLEGDAAPDDPAPDDPSPDDPSPGPSSPGAGPSLSL